MKIIFLDVDGVLVRYPKGSRISEPRGELQEELLENLKYICQQSEVNLVLSSSWKKSPEKVHLLKTTLRKYDLEIFDSTPDFDYKPDVPPFYSPQYYIPNTFPQRRTWEIKKWISNQSLELENWVAIDDASLKLDKSCFVRTKTHLGLTIEKRDAVVEIFQNNGIKITEKNK
jgi:hypothetical protein